MLEPSLGTGDHAQRLDRVHLAEVEHRLEFGGRLDAEADRARRDAPPSECGETISG
jgi:hypothetical protein